MTPPSAQRHCINRLVGTNGQKGWRLASIAELASLVDTTSSTCGAPDFICLPYGSPFEIQSTGYWSASEVAGFPTSKWAVDFTNGFVGTGFGAAGARAWCVRGATDAEVY